MCFVVVLFWIILQWSVVSTDEVVSASTQHSILHTHAFISLAYPDPSAIPFIGKGLVTYHTIFMSLPGESMAPIRLQNAI